MSGRITVDVQVGLVVERVIGNVTWQTSYATHLS
jgi:hypothetical protein